MDATHQANGENQAFEPWEYWLLERVASAFRTPNRDELEAVLAHKLLALKRQQPPNIRDWRAYLAKFFYNKAHNFVRDERARIRRLAFHSSAVQLAPHQRVWDIRSGLTAVFNDLTPAERRLWNLLAEENGNRSRVAKRLGVHRNTIRLRIAKMQAVLARHGFSGDRG